MHVGAPATVHAGTAGVCKSQLTVRRWRCRASFLLSGTAPPAARQLDAIRLRRFPNGFGVDFSRSHPGSTWGAAAKPTSYCDERGNDVGELPGVLFGEIDLVLGALEGEGNRLTVALNLLVVRVVRQA
jgi:hypothetical protein